jgi:hypothetical protein
MFNFCLATPSLIPNCFPIVRKDFPSLLNTFASSMTESNTWPSQLLALPFYVLKPDLNPFLNDVLRKLSRSTYDMKRQFSVPLFAKPWISA